jgi:hypothetical protein
MNTLLAIAPFFKHGTWVFTDERRNLVEEPFVAGVPEIITEIVADIPNAKAGFRLTFSAGAVSGSRACCHLRRRLQSRAGERIGARV